MGSTEKEAGGAARTSVGAEGLDEGSRLVGHGERYSVVMASYLNAVMEIILIHIFQATLNTELST